jgi:hypothetical protein
MKTKMSVFSFLGGLLLAIIAGCISALAQDASEDPPFEFLDGVAIVTSKTHIYADRSSKSKKLAELTPFCKIGFNAPVNPGEGYENWLRVTDFECPGLKKTSSGPQVRSLIGFVQEKTVIPIEEIDLAINEKDKNLFNAMTVRSCPSYKCQSLFSIDDIDFSKSTSCILTYTQNPKFKGYDKGWRLIVTDYCAKKAGPRLSLRYVNIMSLPRKP